MGVKITTNMGLCLHLALRHMGRSPMFTNCEVSHVLMSLTTTMSTKKPMYLPSTHMHNLHNLFTPLCTGVDVADQYICHRIGMECSFVPERTRRMMIHYFDLEGRVQVVPNEKEVKEILGDALIIWNCNINVGDDLAKVSDGHSLMGRGFYVLEGKNHEELIDGIKQIKNMFVTV